MNTQPKGTKTKGFKIIVGVTALVVVVVAAITLYFAPLLREEPADIAPEAAPYRAYLRDFLAATGLFFVPAEKNGFVYYELHCDDRQLQGFVFLGDEEGWGGPINLFVKTDRAGIIQRVHVWQHEETPIYVVGMDEFLATFVAHRAESELTWQEDVHGITGATVTAEAIIAAIYEPGITAYRKGIFQR